MEQDRLNASHHHFTSLNVVPRNSDIDYPIQLRYWSIIEVIPEIGKQPLYGDFNTIFQEAYEHGHDPKLSALADFANMIQQYYDFLETNGMCAPYVSAYEGSMAEAWKHKLRLRVMDTKPPKREGYRIRSAKVPATPECVEGYH